MSISPPASNSALFSFRTRRIPGSSPARRKRSRASIPLATFALVSLVLVLRPVAADETPDDLCRQQLAAGEFAPAWAAAEQLPPGTRRAAQRAKIVRAQMEAGALRSAVATAGYVRDDDERDRLLREIQSLPASTRGAFGGSQADFDSLINLITSTIAPTTWEDNGGLGTLDGFEGGVYCDPAGVLRPLLKEDRSGKLAALRRAAIGGAADLAAPSPARQKSSLRKISLPRLERAVQLRAAAGQPPTSDMRFLAGLQRIQYVLLDPENHDVILAGPAGDWREDQEGRVIGVDSDLPLLQLDDLVVVLRHLLTDDSGRFGCSITPTQEGLARTNAFVAESNKTPLKPGQRGAWLEKLRAQLGRQDIDVYGIDPRTRAGRILVEADYRMKLVGLGLEPGVLGVRSYLDSIALKPGDPAPPMDVLRWWFTPRYDSIAATPQRDAFELKGPGVQVLSENELLTLRGERVPTGTSTDANQMFTQSFTQHFADLAKKFPIYAELRNLFDLAIVGALLKTEHVQDKVGWHARYFTSLDGYQPALSFAPKQVDTVIAHRVVHRTIILVGVSGGVSADPLKFVGPDRIKTDDYGVLKAERARSLAGPKQIETWWWD